MKPVRFVLQPLLDLFQRLQALTMPEMKAALGTRVDMTVFRKLATLGYLTSYSHRGSYYTLKSIPRFDAQGLWLARGAWFSRQGTLLRARGRTNLDFALGKGCNSILEALCVSA